MTRQKQDPNRRCSIAGCDRPHKGKGYCNLHYQRWLAHGDPLAGRKRKVLKYPVGWVCSVGGCGQKILAHGLCSKHYTRLKRHGSTDRVFKGRGFGVEHKATIKASVKATPRLIEWAAGFLEGEGSFSGGGTHGYGRVSAPQVQRWPLEQLQKLFGGTIADYREKRNTYHWWVTGSRARGVMMTLYSLVSPKRQEQIRAALHSA